MRLTPTRDFAERERNTSSAINIFAYLARRLNVEATGFFVFKKVNMKKIAVILCIVLATGCSYVPAFSPSPTPTPLPPRVSLTFHELHFQDEVGETKANGVFAKVELSVFNETDSPLAVSPSDFRLNNETGDSFHHIPEVLHESEYQKRRVFFENYPEGCGPPPTPPPPPPVATGPVGSDPFGRDRDDLQKLLTHLECTSWREQYAQEVNQMEELGISRNIASQSTANFIVWFDIPPTGFPRSLKLAFRDEAPVNIEVK